VMKGHGVNGDRGWIYVSLIAAVFAPFPTCIFMLHWLCVMLVLTWSPPSLDVSTSMCLSPTRSHFLRDTHHHLSLSLHSFPPPPIYSILHPPATGRKLVWQHALAHCVIGATYAGWRHELILSGYQAVVLLLFNQADALSLSELRRMSALPDKELGTVCALSALCMTLSLPREMWSIMAASQWLITAATMRFRHTRKKSVSF
jgi:hypothetical protein